MDDARFDRWTQGLGAQLTRRGIGGLAIGALAAAGWASASDAKGKKGKKKKKKNKGQVVPPPPPPPPPPPAATCKKVDVKCEKGTDSCCAVSAYTIQPICEDSWLRSANPICCMPTGSRSATYAQSQIYCCGGGWKFDQPGNYDAPGECCVRNDWTPLPGETADACCNGAYLFQGRCALPPGHTCYQDHVSLCWDGSTCNGNRCPDA